MNAHLNLKQIERRAFRATYQDGLWDIYYGLIVWCFAFFMYRPPQGYSPVNIILALTAFGLSYLLFWLGKKFITLPRMGQVKFGEIRKKRKHTMILILGLLVLVQAGIVSLTVFGWLNPTAASSINKYLTDRDIMDLTVASIGALFIGSGIALTAYFTDFLRGYYIAILMMLAAFLMIYLNQPIYPLILGVLIILPGIVLFIRFLQKYPRPQEVGDEHS